MEIFVVNVFCGEEEMFCDETNFETQKFSGEKILWWTNLWGKCCVIRRKKFLKNKNVEEKNLKFYILISDQIKKKNWKNNLTQQQPMKPILQSCNVLTQYKDILNLQGHQHWLGHFDEFDWMVGFMSSIKLPICTT